MELWIRSQDKMVLTKIYDLRVDLHIGNEYKIQCNLDERKADYYLLGTYKTKERALEVLDEIQTRIINLQLVELEEKGQARKDARINDELKCIYEMPEE